jgi:cell division protein FtsQ
MDYKGRLFPLTPMVSARVIPANGYIRELLVPGKSIMDSLYRKSALPGLYRLAMEIDKHPFLKAAISQIFINSRKEVDLIPELGSHIVHFGNFDSIDIKLENLEAFYKQALIKEGWNKYNRINLAFTNQVVCTKK